MPATITKQHKNVSSSKNNVEKNNTFFQPKLTINHSNDVFEQEADAVAEKVTGKQDGNHRQNFFKPSPAIIQRKCQHCEEEEKLQRKETTPETQQTTPQTESYINSLGGKGSPLTTGERKFFQPHFGYDLSKVQLHTDGNADESAKNINALAYTHGNNIVFRAGQYQPGTESSNRLMAHELTHVVQQSNSSAHTNVQRDEDKTQSSNDNGKQISVQPRQDVNELNYAFIFAGGPYGEAAEKFIRKYNPDHALIKANSFEEMIDRLYTDVSKKTSGKRNHIQEIIIVTHANAAGGMQIPLARTDAQNHRFFTPWDLAGLQKDFRGGLFTKFRQRRSDVVSAAIDDSTTVVVRGCEFGQSQEAMDALRSFFGGQPFVWAPKAFQGYETVNVGKNNFLQTPEQAFDFLVKQDFLPPDLSPAPDEQKKAYISRVFGRQSIPDEFFVIGQEAHDKLKKEIDEGKGLSQEAEQLKDRKDAGVPGGDLWGSSTPSALGSDSELDGLTREEIEKRASALMKNYRPENAPMLRRLRAAWERVTRDEMLSQKSSDPLFGLPPENIFGDSNLIAIDAAKYEERTPHSDLFETETLPSLETTAKQIAGSKNFDNEIGDVSKDEPQQDAQSTVASKGSTSPTGTPGSSAGDNKKTMQQIIDDLKMRGGDFSKSHKPPPAQPVIPDEVPTPSTTADSSKKEESSLQLPGITRQFSELESAGIEFLLELNPSFTTSLEAAKLLTSVTDTTVGIGIQGGANAVAGVSPGGGIVIRGGRIIALYGSIAGNAGVTIGLSAEVQITVIEGGLENFSGKSVAITGGGGELAIGHVSLLLNTDGDVIGASISGGIGASITVFEAYMSYQGTHVPGK